MGDSQNWSSFDDEPKPIAAPKKTETLQQNEQDTKIAGFSALTQPAALRNLRNRLIFGSLVGFVTGATFGGIDGAKMYIKTHGKFAPAALSSVARGAGVTGGAFSGFFFAYQGVKTVLVTQRGEDDLTNAGIATIAAGLPFIRSTVMKQNLPYALMLVVLDHFHEEISEYRT